MVNIKIDHLSFSRKDFSLQLDNLTISSGEKVALMGENGCGKSTLINLMSGLIETSSKSVFYNHDPLAQLSHLDRAKLFSILPQFSDISFPFSVFEVVQLGRFAHMQGKTFNHDDAEKTEQLLKLLDIYHYRNKSYAELSGGEKRRVMLARVLNQQAPIIYLDEPNSSLDIRHTLEIFHHLSQLPQTIITSVHDINLAHRYFDRFLFFKQGKLLHDVNRCDVTSSLLSEVYNVSVSTNTSSFSFQP